MKHFLMGLLGTLAGIWLSVLIGMILCVAFVIVGAASSFESPEIKIDKHSVLRIDLSGTVTDRVTPMKLSFNELYGPTEGTVALNELVAAINGAATDKDIDGIFIEANGATAGLAQVSAITNALNEFKKSGKWIYSYGDQYTQGNYMISSVSDSIFLNPIGMVDVHGLSSTTMYFKDLLDKLGVEVQVVKVGTYKSAVEPFIMNHMSDANREQQTLFLGNIWKNVSGQMASNRSVTTEKINTWADSYLFSQPSEFYMTEGVVDRLAYRHQIDSLLRAETGRDKDDDIRYVNPSDYVKARKLMDHKNGKKHQIAVLYAVGDITENGDDGIASSSLVPEILKISEDDDVDALVMRVNSGGGSAFASEQIWEALEQFKQKTGKPFYVSMGDMAASGGYYISCGADKIFAEAVTLTGSIGIFGMIPNAQKLMKDKLGITTAEVSTNKGSYPNLMSPMSPQLYSAMQGYVDRGYELFVRRCAEGRDMSVDSIKAIAEGRVWDGATALSIGLVDEIGGLDKAIDAVVSHLDCHDNYYVKEYPRTKYQWWEELVSLSKNVKASIVSDELGELAPCYQTLKEVKDLYPIQCRMDYIEIR